MKQQIFSIMAYISLFAPIYIYPVKVCQRIQDVHNLDEQIYRSLVYIPKDVRGSIVALNSLLPEHPWSSTYKSVCLDINNNGTVMTHTDVVYTLNECLEACNILSFDKSEMIKTELEKYKQLLDAGKAHICNWKDDEVNEMVNRNFDDNREILQLNTRSLTVDGTETVNGLLSVNGVLKINGRIILNDTDISTALAAVAASSVSSVSVTSLSDVINNDIAAPANPVANITQTIEHAVQIGSANNSLTSMPNGTTGQVLTAQTNADPIWDQPPMGIVTLTCDYGSVTNPTICIKSNGVDGAGASIKFAAEGTNVSLFTTDEHDNNFLGLGSGNPYIVGIENAGYGTSTLAGMSSGAYNTACGASALKSLLHGSSNVAVGRQALALSATGSFNTALGYQASVNYNGSESNNVSINSPGISGESNVLRIGAGTGTGEQQLNATYISGIRAVSTKALDAIPILIDSNNQMGTIFSSKRFKENIVPMPASFSENVLNLNPTLFNYTKDETKTQTWGLIAEDVQQIFPGLVVNDKEGSPFTVKYHELPVLLLNELIKLKKENVEIKQELEKLKKGK